MKVYGIAEIADALDMERNTVGQWRVRGKLPEPDAVLAMGPVWFGPRIERWIAKEKDRRYAEEEHDLRDMADWRRV